eukprot:5372159-Pleurochrysis_carterae.AAC.1
MAAANIEIPVCSRESSTLPRSFGSSHSLRPRFERLASSQLILFEASERLCSERTLCRARTLCRETISLPRNHLSAAKASCLRAKNAYFRA